jgi:hypothetical protein
MDLVTRGNPKMGVGQTLLGFHTVRALEHGTAPCGDGIAPGLAVSAASSSLACNPLVPLYCTEHQYQNTL